MLLLDQKWDGFEMKNVSLELHKAAIYRRKGGYKNLIESDEKDDKVFVAFKIDSIPERRPFLLSRDFAYVRPSGRNIEPFQGIIYRVVKSNLVLVEFGEDFYLEYDRACKYDVKFSFNRWHQTLLRNFLFPERVPQIRLAPTQLSISHKLDREQVSAVRQILSLKCPPPYLVEGPVSVTKMDGNTKRLSRSGVVVQEAVLQVYRTSPSCRILICAPLNSTCDVFTRSLKMQIPESEMFRANAAFRELDGVPFDILPSCLYKGECFSCPPRVEISKYKVILSTFMSSFQLHGVGIVAGHFSHIFLVDASSATEPETLVTLANLANENTVVVVTGALRDHSGWVRSPIARYNGLSCSYFERLRQSELYNGLDPKFMTQLQERETT
ncbi:unnamed protein product [Ilex paraguariensis]|uniref:Helicase MOV-10-like beta-barrel domain-containing protein n=1 Tax=Ilex paraguariensis TaxID=185542 RepID=A0ABC8V4C9_9AQUA